MSSRYMVALLAEGEAALELFENVFAAEATFTNRDEFLKTLYPQLLDLCAHWPENDPWYASKGEGKDYAISWKGDFLVLDLSAIAVAMKGKVWMRNRQLQVQTYDAWTDKEISEFFFIEGDLPEIWFPTVFMTPDTIN